MKTFLVHLTLLFALLYGLNRIGSELFALNRSERAAPRPNVFFTVDPKILDLFTLGHRRLVEHVAVISAVQYYGDRELRQKVTFEDLERGVIQSVLNLKPRIEDFYILSCYIAALDYKRPEKCEAITQSALEAIPGAWRVAIAQGYVEKFILKNDAKAALYYSLAANKEGAPAYFARIAKKFADASIDILKDPDFEQSILELPQGSILINSMRKNLLPTDPNIKKETTP